MTVHRGDSFCLEGHYTSQHKRKLIPCGRPMWVSFRQKKPWIHHTGAITSTCRGKRRSCHNYYDQTKCLLVLSLFESCGQTTRWHNTSSTHCQTLSLSCATCSAKTSTTCVSSLVLSSISITLELSKIGLGMKSTISKK